VTAGISILARTHGAGHGDRQRSAGRRRAEDAVQQTLVIAWGASQLRDRAASTPGCTLLVNASTPRPGARGMSANVRASRSRAAGSDQVVSVDNRDRLERGFRRLPPDQRAILVFTHYLGLTPTEIAERLEIPVGTARSRLHYAHRAMRAAIEADERPVAVAGGRPR